MSFASPLWILVFLFKAGDIGLGDKFFEELKKHNGLLSRIGSFEEALPMIYRMVPDFVPTPKQLLQLRDAEALLEEGDSPRGEKIFRERGWIEARLVALDFILKKFAQ